MRLVLFQAVCLLADAIVLAGVARRVPRDTAVVAAACTLVLPLFAAGFVFPGDMLPFACLRLAAYVIFVHVPFVLFGAALVLRARRAVAAGLACAALLVLFVALRAFVIEPAALAVRRYTVRSAEVTRRLRIVVLSDIQTDHVGAYEEDVVARAMRERPSLLLFPGDYIQLPLGAARDREQAKLSRLLAGMHAPLGAYAVQGNVDPSGAWERIFEGTPVVARPHTHRAVRGEVTVTSLSFEDSFDPALRVVDAPGFHVVFGHGPDFALGDVGADLLVAGHTHGGQVVVPFFGPPITFSRVPRDWAGGRTALSGGRTLVVSRGIGMERGVAPRLRFLCPPELVVIDVSPR